MLEFLNTAGQMIVVFGISAMIIGFVVPPAKRAIDKLEDLQGRK
jgi:hypothetical protein